MLETVRNAFKIKDIRKKLIYTFFMLIVIRIGSQLPIPGVNGRVFSEWFKNQTSDGLGFFNAITGGSFLNMSVFAPNITPYITASIIIQLLTVAIPQLEKMQEEILQRKGYTRGVRDHTPPGGSGPLAGEYRTGRNGS